MRYHFWYVLIHIGLGVVGYQYFTFTNIGGIYAFGAALIVQAYAIYEIHRDAKPKFDASLQSAESFRAAEEMKTDYRKRLGRLWLTRSCMYALLTLLSTMAVRGGVEQ
ncbi:MAG: hypothetical protein CMM52_04275 [Rhodospirillaceae bacterium]|nr:hypothetical protein [Rhodospirillaceae bacterium]|tara:strand:+ start:37909 stop:38232 length:324 start_codon:yes stop_codon:yes gene_type:complete